MEKVKFKEAIKVQQQIDILTDFMSKQTDFVKVSFGYSPEIKIPSDVVIKYVNDQIVRLEAELTDLGVEGNGKAEQ